MGDVAEISVRNKCELLQAREMSQLYKYAELSFLKKTVNLNKSGLVHLLYLETARADVITGDATEARTSRKEGREKGWGRGVFRRERASDPRRRAARARISVLRL